MNTLSKRMAALYLFAGLPLLAQEQGEKLDELEPVIVVGGYAIPQMWKIAKGDHVMWVLNTGGPAPAGVRWRLEQLEARVAESQLVLYPNSTPFVTVGNIGADIRRDERYSGKGTLKDELPPEIYARWRVLKTAYFGVDDAIEKWRPSVAIEKLENRVVKATRRSPQPTGPALRSLVDKVVEKYKVKVRTMPTVHRSNIGATKSEKEMVHLNYVQVLGDMKCFTQHLDYLERLTARGIQQASAPKQDYEDCYPGRLARGDSPDPAAARSAYDKILIQPQLAWQQVDAEWMSAAKAALEKNKSTFAVLPSRWTMGRYNHDYIASYIAKFRELGYEVEEPGSIVH